MVFYFVYIKKASFLLSNLPYIWVEIGETRSYKLFIIWRTNCYILSMQSRAIFIHRWHTSGSNWVPVAIPFLTIFVNVVCRIKNRVGKRCPLTDSYNLGNKLKSGIATTCIAMQCWQWSIAKWFVEYCKTSFAALLRALSILIRARCSILDNMVSQRTIFTTIHYNNCFILTQSHPLAILSEVNSSTSPLTLHLPELAVWHQFCHDSFSTRVQMFKFRSK